MSKKVAEDMIIYIIEHDNGSRSRITVPDSWKVTFGPAVKGFNSGSDAHRKVPMALRFYESDTKQRAIFTDVKGFRDASIKIEREHVKVQEKAGFMECDGVRKRTTFQAQVKEWVADDDKEPAELPKLPSDASIFGAETEDED